MKKSILNLGKSLNKAQQKNVFGGLTDLKYDDGCATVEGVLPRGCPCSSNSHCITPVFNVNTKRWSDGQGTCMMGNCI